MVRAAAKNFEAVAVATSSDQYAYVLDNMKAHHGSLHAVERRALAKEAFQGIAGYDLAISRYFGEWNQADVPDERPSQMALVMQLNQALRYGENPHQRAAFY